ncbi:plasma membrane fusion protein prm1 [Ceratobasidium sp. 392]|nr:plasma membrane fusion protein prm1 [Ceratobasidium sp. 392]
MAVPRLASPPPLYAANTLNTPQAHFTTLKPYLTLPYLLSLTWLATPIISLLFIIFRLIISQGAAQDGVEDAKGVLIASCAAAERAAQGVGSIGSFMAAGTNRQIEAAVNATIDAARATMIFSLTALQGIIEFVIDMYRSIFLCFLELVVRGGLAIIIGALTEITNFLQNAVGGLKSSIQGDIQSANNAIATAVNAINSVTKISELERTREAWTTDSAVQQTIAHGDVPTMAMTNDNMMMLHVTQQHPLLFAMANRLAIVMRLSATSYTHLRFFLAYIFHPAALACLLIGVFGLISVEVQIAALGPIQKHYSSQVSNSIGDFTNSIAVSINSGMQNDSAFYAAQVNAQTTAMQTTINDGLFGWVNGTTVTLNSTLVAFYSDVQTTVDAVFGGTLLEVPAQEFVRCLIGTKVQGLENALTFIHDNLKVNMPTVSDDVLLLSNSSVDAITQPISLAAVGDGSASEDGSGSGIVGRVIARYIASLEKERLMFFIFIGIWGFVVLIALCIVLWHTFGARWLHNRRQRAWEQGQSFGPFSRRPSEQSRYAFPGVPGGQPLDVVHGRALWDEEGKKGGLKRLFSGGVRPEQREEQQVKWQDGQNVHTVVHVQGGASGGWVGRLKSAMARRKADKQSLEPVPFTNTGDANAEPKKSRGITSLAMPQEEIEVSAWSASPTTQPPKPWNPLAFTSKPNAPSPPPAAPAPSRSELTASFMEDARPVIYEQRGALPLHMHFSKRSPSPDAPVTPPGLPVSVGHTPDEYTSRQVPPVSNVPGGRIPHRHRAQNSSLSLNGANPFVTPFDDERRASGLDGRYPVMGRAI